jgi:DNA-directed RNA polymerase subunit L
METFTRTIAVNFATFSSDPPILRHVDIRIDVDVDGLADDLGNKAARSKSGQSVEAGGKVRVRVIAKAEGR